MTRPAFPDCWPTPEQELLLEAALLDGPGAIESWRSWRAGASLERLDVGSLGLLPLAYKNLVGSRADVSELKALYVSTLARNEFLTRRVARVLSELDAAGVPSLLLKGAALIARHYPDAGCRPMADVDVLVPRAQARKAIETLEGSDWHTERRLSDELLLDEKGAPFRDRTGFEIDLHWAALEEASGLDADLWATSQPLQFGGTDTRCPDPVGELLIVCVHGLKWRDPPSLRWVADAHTIVGHSSLDWKRLLRLVEAHCLSPQLETALGYLLSRFQTPVPANIVTALRANASSALDGWAFRARTQAPQLRGVRSVLALHLHSYRRRARAGLVPHGPLGLATSIARTWQLKTAAHVPRHIILRGWERMRSLLSARTSEPGRRSP